MLELLDQMDRNHMTMAIIDLRKLGVKRPANPDCNSEDELPD